MRGKPIDPNDIEISLNDQKSEFEGEGQINMNSILGHFVDQTYLKYRESDPSEISWIQLERIILFRVTDNNCLIDLKNDDPKDSMDFYDFTPIFIRFIKLNLSMTSKGDSTF